jgi:hypothetical protein
MVFRTRSRDMPADPATLRSAQACQALLEMYKRLQCPRVRVNGQYNSNSLVAGYMDFKRRVDC